MFEMKNVSKVFTGSFGKVIALDNIDFSVEPGEMLTVQGPSGCGKTTLLLIAGAMMKPTDGTVLIDGKNPYSLDQNQRAGIRQSAIGFVFQQFNLVPYLTVLENVILPADPSLDSRVVLDKAESLLEHFDLSDRAEHKPGELSTGQQQRTALARALINNPRLILADEPTGNLDRQNAQVVIEHLREIADAGAAVLIVTHDAEIEQMTENHLRLDKGVIVEHAESVSVHKTVIKS